MMAATMNNSTSSRVSGSSKSSQYDSGNANINKRSGSSGTDLIRRRCNKKNKTSSALQSGDASSRLFTNSIPSSAPSSVPSLSNTSTPVSQIMVPGGGIHAKDPDESVVITYVSRSLFHMVKFVTSKECQLAYSTTDPTSICYNVLVGCLNTAGDVDRSEWWNTKASGWVHATITGLRNNKMTALKWMFFGK